jgi:hypothetical protein
MTTNMKDTLSNISGAAVVGAASGAAGRWGLAFFRPELATTALSYGHYAAMGAVALPLAVLPSLLIDKLTKDSKFFEAHPIFKQAVKDTASLLTVAGGVAGAAFMLSAPIMTTMISMMVIPAALYALSMLKHAFDALKPAEKKETIISNSSSIVNPA